jgi:hypothetical protein
MIDIHPYVKYQAGNISKQFYGKGMGKGRPLN